MQENPRGRGRGKPKWGIPLVWGSEWEFLSCGREDYHSWPIFLSFQFMKESFFIPWKPSSSDQKQCQDLSHWRQNFFLNPQRYHPPATIRNQNAAHQCQWWVSLFLCISLPCSAFSIPCRWIYLQHFPSPLDELVLAEYIFSLETIPSISYNLFDELTRCKYLTCQCRKPFLQQCL